MEVEERQPDWEEGQEAQRVEEEQVEEEEEEKKEERVSKSGKVLKPPVASRAAVNKKLGLTQSRRQAGSCTERAEREVVGGGEEVVEVESRRGEEVPRKAKDGRQLCNSGGGEGGEGVSDGETVQGIRLRGDVKTVVQLDQSDQNQKSDVQLATGNREKRMEEEGGGGRGRSKSGGDGAKGELGRGGLSTLERVSKVSSNRTTVTYWSEQFL